MTAAVCPYCKHEFIPDDYHSMSEYEWEEYDCPKCDRAIQLRIVFSMDFDVREEEKQ